LFLRRPISLYFFFGFTASSKKLRSSFFFGGLTTFSFSATGATGLPLAAYESKKKKKIEELKKKKKEALQKCNTERGM
jgi:hypothetical protein